MCIRRTGLALGAVFLFLGTGCKKSPSAAGPDSQPSADTIARVHWLGSQRMAAPIKKTFPLGIWNMPESEKLGEEALDKLALAPWRLLSGQSGAGIAAPAADLTIAITNHPSATWLRPLLNDLVEQEFYVEMQQATNRPFELALAVRLNNARAALWETNLAAALESLTGVKPSRTAGSTSYGWQFQFKNAAASARQLSLSRAGEWTFLSLSEGAPRIVTEFVTRLRTGGAPFVVSKTNYWLEADADLAKVSSALNLGLKLPTGLPRVSLGVLGDANSIRTSGRLDFPKPLGLQLEDWNIPTNVIHDPIVSFCAIRGFGPLLSSLPAWTNLQFESGPNQFFLWSIKGLAFNTYWAAPWPNASNVIVRLTERLRDQANPWMATNQCLGSFSKPTNAFGLVWDGLGYAQPFLQPATNNNAEFVVGGVSVPSGFRRPAPAELLTQLHIQTNLVWYDWEQTSQRVLACNDTAQLFRLAMHRDQLAFEGPGLKWLHAAAPQLVECGTLVTLTAPNQLSVYRRSDCGLTAAEMQLFADWVESPRFPFGLHSELEASPIIPDRKSRPSGTNQAPRVATTNPPSFHRNP